MRLNLILKKILCLVSLFFCLFSSAVEESYQRSGKVSVERCKETLWVTCVEPKLIADNCIEVNLDQILYIEYGEDKVKVSSGFYDKTCRREYFKSGRNCLDWEKENN